MAHAPTTVLNDSEWVAEMVARERLRDPDNARREFDAEFMATGTLLFFEAESLETARVAANPIREPSDLLPGDIVVAGMDAGFRSDSSALVIVVRRGTKLYVVACLEMRPDAGKPLQPRDVVATFAAECQRWGVRYVMADAHYRESITEHLTAFKLVYVPAPHTPSEPYVRTRVLLREDRLTLPDDARLIQQMREVQGRAQSGGGLTIIHPRWATGGHGDLCAALVLAVDQAGGAVVKPPPPVKGTAEWEAVEREARRKQIKEANDRSKPADRGRNAHWRKTG